jgi:hypothetical protein
MTLEAWATAQAERLIAPLGDRWTRVQAVADKARDLAAVLSPRMPSCWWPARFWMTWATLPR